MTAPDDITDNVTYLSSAHLPPREDRDWVTSQELLEHAGISYRQLDYWCRTSLLTPIGAATPGSGLMRRFTEHQAERAWLIHALLESGMSLQMIRQVIDEIQQTGTVQIGVLTITIQPSGDAA